MRLPKIEQVKSAVRSPYFALFLLAVTAISITLDAWGLRPWGHVIDYERFGTWDDFVVGASTFAAVVVALRGISTERQRAESELDRLRDRELTQVFCWLTPKKISSSSTLWYLTFENNTGLPIFQWTVDLGPNLKHACGTVSGPIRPHASSLFIPELANQASAQVPKPILMFVDIVGRPWSRDGVGLLKPTVGGPTCDISSEYRADLGRPGRDWVE